MTPKILVADDDESVQRLLTRTFGETTSVLCASDGEEAFRIAQTEELQLIVLDVEMPLKDGLKVLGELRKDPRLRGVPIIMLTGRGALKERVAGLDLGADDYVVKPFSPMELRARVESLLRRNRRDTSANPLTGLPGNPAIEEEVERRIASGKRYAFLYADLDNFKAYNDHYGYADGDAVIKETARVLMQSLREEGDAEDFLGHVGGDDFVVVCDASRAASIAKRAAELFDARAPFLYTPEDREKGCIETQDRQGRMHRFPLLAVSMGIVTNERRELAHYGRVVELASEMKRFVKSRAQTAGSAFAFDRRTDEKERLQ
ncbi:MAG: response regulator [Elusimicrobiota bacterium]|jgi:diguanylate cyclase (GGDEF)-like protein